METVTNIGERLYNLRMQKGETQEAVAEATGITYVSLCRYETGKRMPKMNILAKLAEHYNVSIDEIVNGTEKESPVTGAADGNLKRMYEEFAQLSPEDQQRVLDFVAGIISVREQ